MDLPPLRSRLPDRQAKGDQSAASKVTNQPLPGKCLRSQHNIAPYIDHTSCKKPSNGSSSPPSVSPVLPPDAPCGKAAEVHVAEVPLHVSAATCVRASLCIVQRCYLHELKPCKRMLALLLSVCVGACSRGLGACNMVRLQYGYTATSLRHLTYQRH